MTIENPTTLFKKRLFIGNLHEEITSEDLGQRFQNFGSVHGVDVRHKNESTFAFIDIEFDGDASLRRCIDVLNNAKWKGLLMKVQVAKENFIEKLRVEREAAKRAKRPRPPDNFDFEIVSSTTTTAKPPTKDVKKPLLSVSPTKNSTKLITNQRNNADINPNPSNQFNGSSRINTFKEDKELQSKVKETAKEETHLDRVKLPEKETPAPNATKTKKNSSIKPSKLQPKSSSSSSDSSSDSDSSSEDETINKLKLPMFKGILAYPTLAEEFIKQEDETPLTTPLIHPSNPLQGSSSSASVSAPNPKPPPPSAASGSGGGMKINPLKKQKSDAARVQSLQNRVELNKSRQGIVHAALSNSLLVEQEKLAQQTASTTAAGGSSAATAKSTTTLGQDFLFGGDAEEDEEQEDVFKVKPQYEGKSGQQLMELSSKFGGDERFRFDERFAEPDKEPKDEDEEENEQSVSEKQVQLSVLNELFGPSLSASSSSGTGLSINKINHASASSKSYIDASPLGLVRYTPSSIEHQMKYQVKPEADDPCDLDKKSILKSSAAAAAITGSTSTASELPSPTKKSKRKNKETPTSTEAESTPAAVTVNEKPSYKVASNLKQLFTSTSSTPGDSGSGSSMAPKFSLLNSFSSNSNSINKTLETNDDFVELKKTAKKDDGSEPLKKQKSASDGAFWNTKQSNPFKYDSSSDDDDHDDEKTGKTKELIKKPTAALDLTNPSNLFLSESFFFQDSNDPRLANAYDGFLVLDEDMSKLHAEFNDGGGRAELKTIVKAKWRNSKRKNEKRVKAIKLVKKKKRRDALRKAQHQAKIRAMHENKEQH